MGFPSTSKMWKKDETAALIALFETERCLYDSRERDFHDPDKKTEAYERICKIMLRIRSDVSIDEIKYKIKVLRKQYVGELFHRNISIESGLCTKDSYKPGMWCFGLLQFLDDYLNVTNLEDISRNDEESDKEIFNITETDNQKDAEECSDVADESDDHEEVEERTSCKKKKVESSSSSSDRESLNSSIRKFLSSSSEKKLQNTSFSVKKFQSSSSVERELQNSSSVERKLHNSSSSARKFPSNLPSEKKIHKPSPLVKKFQDSSSSYKKLQNTLSSQKKCLNLSPSLKLLQSASERKVPSKSSNFEKNRKSYSSERKVRTSPLQKESKNNLPENHLKNQSSPERDLNNSFSAAKDTRINSFERELFNASFSGKEFDTSENNSRQNSLDREDIFGRYVACELRALRSNPLIYLQTKQSILESLTSANFELINPE